MTISSVSSTSSDFLLTKLETNGLSASKAQLVEDDLSEISATASSDASASGPVDMKAMRAALDKKIDADVSSGKLSASDAAAVKKTLDDMDAQGSGSGDAGQTQTSAASSTQADGAGAAHSSGGGGGGASAKTEVSETVTVSGPLKTTIITYSDGSTATSTTVASPADEQKYGKSSSQSGATDSIATQYLATLAPGSLFNQMA